jgi:hypothetical protein
MNNIEWKDGAVCYAYGKQMDVDRWNFEDMFCMHLSDFDDFQLNEIREGDFIPASELDTEQKYNEVVEVFGLFGFERVKDSLSYSRLSVGATHYLASDDYGIDSVSNDIAFKNYCKGRQLTYNQLMVMGELKRMMLEREESNLTADFTKVSSNKYEREITDRQGNSATVDVYDVLKAFEVTCPATQHAVKKLLCSGLRGHKDLQTDLIEAKESIVRAIELNGG